MADPKISFIMVTPDNYTTCRRTVGYLAQQTAVNEIELILVGPSRQQMQVEDGELTAFHSVQVIEIGHVQGTGQAIAVAIRAAKAPFVAYAEEHSYPEPVLAETVVTLLEQDKYAAVGWSLTNANPGLVSWSHLYGTFGPAVGPVISHEAARLAGHHAAYRRELLLAYGDQLPELLSNEIMLQMDLHRRGYKLFQTGEVVSRHVNVSRLSSYMLLDYMGQRGFAATRARVLNWSWARRLLYAAGAPLIPFVRLRRSLRDVRRTGRAETLLPQIAFIIFLADCCGSIGEALGYLFDVPSNLPEKRMPFELDRFAYVLDQDKEIS